MKLVLRMRGCCELWVVEEVKADIYVFRAGTQHSLSEACVLYCSDGILRRGRGMAKIIKKKKSRYRRKGK